MAVKTRAIYLLTSWFPTVCCCLLSAAFFLLELAGENGCREVERLGCETAAGGWAWRGEGTVCAAGPAAGRTRQVRVRRALWDLPGLAVPWKWAKVQMEPGLGRPGGFWVSELVSDSVRGFLKLGSGKSFLSRTRKTLTIQHKTHPLTLQTSKHVLKQGLAPLRLFPCLFSQFV